jgi:dTDP-4-dehydrorhamnose reductase
VTPTRVLVLGATGMLGHKITEVLSTEPEIDLHATVRGAEAPKHGREATVTYHTGVHVSSSTAPLIAILARLAPDVVVNAIGAIKQKNLSDSVDETFFLNGTLPHALALLNPNRAGRVIHFSTDCVFVGDRGNYTEADTPDAEDLYGRSKACGEMHYGRHLTIRTSIVGFELTGHLGLLGWLFRQAPGSSIRGYANAIFSGLPTVSLSRTVRDVIVGGKEINGLFHVASEPITKYDLLRRVSVRFSLGHQFTADETVKINRSLNDTAFRTRTETNTPNWDDLIEELHQDFFAGPYERIYHELRNQRQ